MKQAELIHQLLAKSKSLNEKAEALKALDISKLMFRPKADAWNTLEVIDHLNQYIEIYNGHFSQSLKKAPQNQIEKEVSRGYFGNLFIGMMEPKADGKIKKMNTFKSKDPIGKRLSKSVLQQFIDLNNETIDYLNKAERFDIQKVKCKLAIPILKLKLSDAFQFIIAHNERHFVQISKNQEFKL